MDELLRRRAMAEINTREITGGMLMAAQITQTAQTVNNYVVTAPDYPDYTFLCWVGISCDDYVGFLTFTNWSDQSNTVWAYRKPSDDTSYHNTFCALYVKTLLADKVHLETVEVTTASARNIVISAPTVDGFNFATWIGVNSSGYTGTPYISNLSLDSTTTWDLRNTSGKKRRAYALYFSDDLVDPVHIECASVFPSNQQTQNVSCGEVANYTFVCWLNASTQGFVGEPGIRNRLSQTCTLYSYVTSNQSEKTFSGQALYLSNALIT